jgi:hypothetical protein
MVDNLDVDILTVGNLDVNILTVGNLDGDNRAFSLLMLPPPSHWQPFLYRMTSLASMPLLCEVEGFERILF